MIILASSSPRRKELMDLSDLNFKVMATNADETVPDGLTPRETVEYLSKIKALPLKNTGNIIIGADTIVSIDSLILGKPKTRVKSREMLHLLSGKTHSVFTGVTIIKNEHTETFSVKTDVVFYELSDEEIENYIATDEPLDKAGAYGIQKRGALFVKEIHGDYSNVVGLPIGEVVRRIKKIGSEL